MGCRLRITEGYEDFIRSLGLDRPSVVRDWARGRCVSRSFSVRVWQFEATAPGAAEPETWFLKVYLYPLRRPRRLLTFTYRKSRTRTEWEALNWLRARGLPGAEPVAYGSERLVRIVRSCWLLTRGVPNAEDLDVFLPKYCARQRDAKWLRNQRQAIADLATIVGKMHGGGFFDHDLKFRNLLVQEESQGLIRWHMIDFPKAHWIRRGIGETKAWREAQCFDLANLDKHAPEFLSRSDRWRFTRTYLRELERSGLSGGRARGRELAADVGQLRQHLLSKRERKLRRSQ